MFFIDKLFNRGKPYIDNRGTFLMGETVRINSGPDRNPIGGSTRAVFVIRPKAILKIGKRVGISNSAIVCWNKITIEDDVFIGGDCKIYDTDFHPVKFSQRVSKEKSLAKTEPVLIKKGAFIGAFSIILKGVTIGEKSVVGAGSVVTKNVPDGEIWAGNPAKFIRKLTNEELQ